MSVFVLSRKNAGQLASELQRRIAQLGSTLALAAINRAYKFICAQGSYTFLLVGNETLVPATGSIGLDDDVDLGKAIFLTNSPSGTPIEKAGIQDFGISQGINIPDDQGYSVYTITGRTLQLRPKQTAQNITILYHTQINDMNANDVPLTPPEFDDTMVGFAEAEERRINDVGDSWTEVYKQKAGEIKQMLEEYRSTSEETGSIGDAQQAVSEKTQLGRG